MIEKEMETFNSEKALKMRAELAEYYEALNRLQYEVFCVNKLYSKKLEDYQTFLGTNKKEDKQ